MRRLLTGIGYVWIGAWFVLYSSPSFTYMMGISHPWPALDGLRVSEFEDWRVLVLWAALITGVALAGAFSSSSK